MGDLDAEELAQLGLKHIEDAVVGLLSRHDGGLTAEFIAERLGLAADRATGGRMTIADAVLGLLVDAGRIHWDPAVGLYRDNPDKL